MKHIVKVQDTPLFDEWKALDDYEWKKTYDDLVNPEKKEVKDSLMKEQGYICCYCERRLTNDDSHIEHFNPQSNNSVDTLNYTNMLCSCQDQLKKGEPRHCGISKGTWFDKDLLISPLDSNSEGRFAYTADGKIQPADEFDAAATKTIEKLKLDIGLLNDFRNKAIEPFLDNDLDDGEVSRFVNGYLKKNSGEMFGEFWTTINYIFVQNVK
ncbi:MAG: TIGR02646 family protein [ANME-2 cluster archaeon]|nr:TIGR02646 family protein [ANME-2 cluster archaeon]MBC2701239.1 TIGR02646 family protein [ANME-2 cluster archaeon]MBC2708911.1 TIGR02646 family protein [ANME-2 cluster archaeon]MBC2746771.1 TIGR02646 family protein [ANME-2 cluster archaeon]MBC2762954.1 TIGR02646 family protein [ANME-2 cluster archaeon]